VHVGGAQLNRLGKNLVHETDDRGAFSGLGQVHILIGLGINDLEAVLAGLGNHRLDRIGTDAQVALDAAVDIRQRRQSQLKVLAGGQTQLVDR